MRLFVLARHGQSELNVTRHVNGDPAVSVKLTAQGEKESARLGAELAADRTRSLRPYALRSNAPDGRDRAAGKERAARSRAAPGRHRRRRPRGEDDRRLPGVEASAHARRRVSGWREPRRRRTTLRPRLRAPARTAPSSGSSSSATRSPSATRSTLRRARTTSTGPYTTSRTAFPTSSTRKGSDALQRRSAAARRHLLPRPLPAVPSVDGLGLPDTVQPALHVGVHHR